MATVNLLPNADVSNSPAWNISIGSDVYAVLDDDHTGNPTGDPSQITAAASGKVFDIGFQSLADVGVDSGDIDTIDSVQGVIKANVYERAKTYELRMRIINGVDGSVFWTYESTGTIGATNSWDTHTFTQRDGYDSGHASSGWSGGQIDGIRMEIKLAALSGGTARVTYAYFIVTYTPAVTVSDNATFFGANF